MSQNSYIHKISAWNLTPTKKQGTGHDNIKIIHLNALQLIKRKTRDDFYEPRDYEKITIIINLNKLLKTV